MPSIDWSSAIDSAGDLQDAQEVLPRADYNFEIIDAEHVVASTGKDMFKVRCRIIDGPHKGRVLYNNFVLSTTSEVAMSIFFRHMKALGLSLEFFKTNPENDEICQALTGVQFRGSVGVETYNGSDRNALKNFFPASNISSSTTPPPPPPPAPGAGVASPSATVPEQQVERAPF